MKKLAIIGASAALATLPVVGVFAAEDVKTATDNISVEVAETCTFESASPTLTKDVTFNLSAGEKKEDEAGSTFKINCNDAGGWELKAKGGSGTTLTGSGAGTGSPIATGSTLSGGTSAWGMKITSETADVQGGYSALKEVPASDTIVAQKTEATDEAEVKTSYSVYIAGDQPADTYTGSVVYTLSHPAGQ